MVDFEAAYKRHGEHFLCGILENWERHYRVSQGRQRQAGRGFRGKTTFLPHVNAWQQRLQKRLNRRVHAPNPTSQQRAFLPRKSKGNGRWRLHWQKLNSIGWMRDMAETTEQQSLSFNGCSLSILLNGLNVLTIDEAVLIKSVLAFIARNENEGLEAPTKTKRL